MRYYTVHAWGNRHLVHSKFCLYLLLRNHGGCFACYCMHCTAVKYQLFSAVAYTALVSHTGCWLACIHGIINALMLIHIEIVIRLNQSPQYLRIPNNGTPPAYCNCAQYVSFEVAAVFLTVKCWSKSHVSSCPMQLWKINTYSWI